jgi:hypothetical protein
MSNGGEKPGLQPGESIIFNRGHLEGGEKKPPELYSLDDDEHGYGVPGEEDTEVDLLPKITEATKGQKKIEQEGLVSGEIGGQTPLKGDKTVMFNRGVQVDLPPELTRITPQQGTKIINQKDLEGEGTAIVKRPTKQKK